MRQHLLLLTTVVAIAAASSSCSSQPGTADLGPGTFDVQILTVNGSTTLPPVDAPLPANQGQTPELWGFTIAAHTPTGEIDTTFNGYVRLTLAPGTVLAVTGTGANGQNILLANGQATGVVQGTAVYGPARLWVEDLGYVPAAPGTVPACSNGIDDNHNGLIDFPSDPGCYYADDDTEDGGTYAAGVSPPVQYALPKVSDVRGRPEGGARTPFPNEAIEIAVADPANLIVTRISSQGFYVTDLNPAEVDAGYNSLFAFNFSVPTNMRLCDRVTNLGGTASDFYGFTQLGFPSYETSYTVLGVDGGLIDFDAGIPGCQVPEPLPILASFFTGDKNTTSKNLFGLESGLVRLSGYKIANNFGPGLAKGNLFSVGVSNCDFNGDGEINYTEIAANGNCPAGQCEGDCASLCDLDPECTEWTSYSARSEYKVSFPHCAPGGQNCASDLDCNAGAVCTGDAASMIQIDTSTVATFDPTANAGRTLPIVSGTLTEFSGGTLNWTVEARCQDDLVCPAAWGCTTQQPIPSPRACVLPRTISDNDEGSD